MDKTMATLGIETTVWVAIIGAAALIAVTVLQNYFARRREDRIRKESGDRAEREAGRVATEREQQREYDLELASRRRKEELSDAWRMTRLEVYRDFRSTVGQMSDDLRGIATACEMGVDVPEGGPQMLSAEMYERWWSVYSEAKLLGGVEVSKATSEVGLEIFKTEAEMANRARDHHGEDTSGLLRLPDAEERLIRALQRFTSAARYELGVEVDEAPPPPPEPS